MRKALTYLLLLALPLTCVGRPVGFSSSRLAAIASAAGLSLPERPTGKRVVFSVACQGRSVPVTVEYDSGEVAHIGLDLFGADVKKENALVCNFVERYLLESLLDHRTGSWNTEPMYGRVVTQGDIFPVLRLKPEDRSVSISLDGEGTGSVEITAGSGPLFSIRFPAEIQLLSGQDKEELEKAFLRKMTGDRKNKKREVPRGLKRVDRDIYVAENGFFEIEAAQNSAFFRKKGLLYVPLCESSHPTESILTLLTGYNRKKDYAVRTTVHQYGFVNTELTVPLDNLIDCCLEEGCVPYVGIESQTDESVVASLFMVNRALGYSHTFQFSVNPEILDKTAGMLSAKAHLYTPFYPKKS